MNMKKALSLILALVIALALPCLSLAEETMTVTGTVTEVEKYGHAVLDITIDDFMAAGFELGDVVTVTAGSFEGDIPFFNGYYVDRGDTMVRAYPGQEYIAVCINYGNFSEQAGVNVGDSVTITLKEAAGALTTQQVNSLAYTNDPADYESDEVFANWRMVTVGNIGEGRLYRSASPVNNEFNRAATANALAEAAGIKTVVNLADTDEELAEHMAAEDFASDYYAALVEGGSVIAMGMPINYTSDEFAEGIAAALTFMTQGEAPYLVHCTEGKDRAGFTSMVLEALMGATLEEIETDYMLSYVNYYHLDPVADADKCAMIISKNIAQMVQVLCGEGADIETADLSAAAESYLTSHGMTADDVAALKAKLQG